MSGSGPHKTAVLCAGILVRDLCFRVAQMPGIGKKTRATDFIEITGGNAVNQAIAIARLGGRAEFCGPVGEDAKPLLVDLQQAGVDCARVVRVKGAKTPVSGIFIDDAGERTIATHRKGDLSVAAPPDAETLVKGFDALSVDNRFPDFVAPICAAARRRDLPVVGDIDSGRDRSEVLFPLATHLIFSEQALTELTQERDHTRALQVIAAQSPALIGVTLGPNGVVWRTPQGEINKRAGFRIHARETLGAGDVFHGALALALGEGKGTDEAMRFASVAAALKCEGTGGARSTPTRAEVEAFLGNPQQL